MSTTRVYSARENVLALKAVDVPTVYGLDITTAGVSLAKITADGARPQLRYRVSPPTAGKNHSLASAVNRMQATTNGVLETVTRDGTRPSLVVMGKPTWAMMNSDPSAARRLGQYWLIVQELAARRIPAAEVPLATAMAWALGRSPGLGAAGREKLTDSILATCPELATVAAGLDSRYRMSAVAYAAMGAMAAGIETPYAPTVDRLRALSVSTGTDRANRGAQWPYAVRPLPKTIADWQARHEKGGVVKEEPSIADHPDNTDTDEEMSA